MASRVVVWVIRSTIYMAAVIEKRSHYSQGTIEPVQMAIQ